MSSNDVVISVKNLSKYFEIYDRPIDRLKQILLPRIQRLMGRTPQQYYREFWALNDLSFDIKRGETVGIVGRNGSGKSTLLQMICGTLTPTSGCIEITGRVAALLELGSGFNPEFSGLENVYMYASVLGLRDEEITARLDQIVAFADIGDFIQQPVKTYSSGMMVRLAFAVIAHVDADILVIDEALAVGDAFFTQKCMRFLRGFMENGTVLFVSHDTAAVINLCSKAILLANGRPKKQGSPKDVAELYLADLYESLQGKSVATDAEQELDLHETQKVVDEGPLRDMRQDFINLTPYRNDLQLFEFDRNSSSFGMAGAKIISVALLDSQDHHLSWIVGGEIVKLKVICQANTKVISPIVGFYLKDKLGQNLFGDNTYKFSSVSPLKLDRNQKVEATFEFRMPILPVGDYSITVALAEGSQMDHIQHDWIHDALIVKSHSSSVSNGLLGVPMNKIGLNKYE